jgi:hypothetical protein
MKSSLTTFGLMGCCLIMIGCGSEQASEETGQKSQVSDKPQFKGIPKSKEPVSLRDQKSGDFFSAVMLPLSALDPETNEDIYLHLTGQVVNINKKQTWAVVQDKDVAYYAFNHAGMPKIKKEYLGKQIYFRAILEEKPLSDNILVDIKNNGLAPGFASDNIITGYQFNTTKAALVDGTDEKVFMKP